MKLYFAPGACSLSPHIALQESGLPYTTEKVDLRAKKTASGADYLEINPKGYVPALVLDNGEVLTEGPAIVQYIADQAKDKQLRPAAGTVEHYHLLEWLNFISAEIHKGFGPLFNPASTDDAKTQALANLAKRFGQANKLLDGRDYLVGDAFSVADGYLFTILNWTKKVGPDLAGMPNLQAFHARIGARPAVQQVMRDEVLLG
jgi:glutathione S-transferase